MKFITLGAVFAAFLFAASTASAEVQLTIQNGRVTLKAKDATLRQIMQEWARVGQTRIVNVERIPGGPIQVIELNNVPEAEALEILLRSISGYIAAPRAVPTANAQSQFDRIVVMATAVAPKAAMSASTSPTFQPPQMPQPVVDDDPDDTPPGGARPPVFGAFPQPQVINPATNQNVNQPPGFVPPQGFGAVGQQPQPVGQSPNQRVNQPTNTFGAPTGVAVPGMMVPVPQQPGQPGVPPGTIVQPGQQGRGRGGQNP
ncbi:MAG TPA: hypothetical protein VEU08_21040 [Vicinamibacterales bacterium]|nr:hypothetical protein [Vicinamibacterales bacterium]